MIIGTVGVIGGLFIGLLGATNFNFGVMVSGYLIAFAGAVVFVMRLIEILL